jgi:hypothetical protein
MQLLARDERAIAREIFAFGNVGRWQIQFENLHNCVAELLIAACHARGIFRACKAIPVLNAEILRFSV